MMRGALFSALWSLGAEMSRVLDLYAGSGTLGIEALSRGAGWSDFVERDSAACGVIRENLRATGFQEQARVHCLSVERAGDRLETGASGPYTLVLADPPYGDAGAIAALESLMPSLPVEAGRTVVVLGHSGREEAPAQLGPLSRLKLLRHGDSAMSIYR